MFPQAPNRDEVVLRLRLPDRGEPGRIDACKSGNARIREELC
jgi:hypothetical protein